MPKVRVKIYLDDDTEYSDFIVDVESKSFPTSKELALEVMNWALTGDREWGY